MTAIVGVVRYCGDLFEYFAEIGIDESDGLIRCILRTMLFMMDTDVKAIREGRPEFKAAVEEFIVMEFRQDQANK